MLRHLPLLAVLIVTLASAGGCNLMANVIYSIRGNKAPADFDGLNGKKVAIVCGTERGLSNDVSATLLTRYVEALLAKNVKGIKIVPQDKVEKWLDANGWDDCDFEEIGKGVGAEHVLSLTMANMTLREGSTLYKGKADVSVTVYDIAAGGNVVYRKSYAEEYPRLGGVPVTDSTMSKFQVLFLEVVSVRIATLFYPADPNEQFGLDAISNSL